MVVHLNATLAFRTSQECRASPSRITRLHRDARHSQVNAAVDDAATMTENVARMLATARGRGKLATHDRKRAQMLMVNVAVSLPTQLPRHSRCYYPNALL